jgi:hypothetical protein
MSTPPTQKNQVRAAEYRDRAAAAFTLAGASVLDRVRERHEAAGERWTDLARLVERPTQSRATSQPMTGA